MNKNYLIGGLGGVVIILLVIYIVGFFTPVAVTPNTPVPDVSVGAIPGNSVPGNLFSVGGLQSVSVRTGFLKATTTIGVITPKQRGFATSTVDEILLNITTGTSTASTIGIATSTSPYASSTAYFVTVKAIAANAKANFTWRPAVGWPGAAEIGPNDYILIQTEGPGLGGYTYGGYYSAKFTNY